MSSSDSDKGEKKPEGMDKIKPPNLSVLMCSRPNNIVSGTIAGIGNTIGGALTGLGNGKSTDDDKIISNHVKLSGRVVFYS